MLVFQPSPTLCDTTDYSPPAFSVHRILQARILEWVAISFSRGSSDPGIKLRSPALQADSLPSEPPGKPKKLYSASFKWGESFHLNKEYTSFAEVAKIYHSKNKSSVPEIVKKEKEIHASFTVTPQAAKVTERGKCPIKMEKSFNLYKKIFWERESGHIHVTVIIVCCYSCSILLLVSVPNL